MSLRSPTLYKQIEEFYRDNYSTLVKRLKRRAGGEENAEDVLQEAFYRALKYWDSYNPDKQPIGAWFNTIMNNTLKRHQSEQMQGGATIPYDEHEHEEGYDCPAEDNLRLEEVIGKLSKCNERNRNILYLYFIKGYRIKEIQDVVGGGYSGIRMLIHRFKLDMFGEEDDE